MRNFTLTFLLLFLLNTLHAQTSKNWSILHHGVLNMPDSILKYSFKGSSAKLEMRGDTRFLIKGDTAISKLTNGDWYLLLHQLSTGKIINCLQLPKSVYYWKIENNKLYYINGIAIDNKNEYEIYELDLATLITTKITDTYTGLGNKHKLPIISPSHIEYLPAYNCLIINKYLEKLSCIINFNTKKVREFGETGELFYNPKFAPGKLVVKPWTKWKEENWGKLEYKEIDLNSYKMGEAVVDDPKKYTTKETEVPRDIISKANSNDKIYFADTLHKVIHSWAIKEKWDGIERAYDYPVKLRYPSDKHSEVMRITAGSLLSILQMKNYSVHCTKELVGSVLRYWNKHSKLKLWFNDKEWRFEYYNDLHLSTISRSIPAEKLNLVSDHSQSNRPTLAANYIKQIDSELKWEKVDLALESDFFSPSAKHFFINNNDYIMGNSRALTLLNIKTATLNQYKLPIYAHDIFLLDSTHLLIGNTEEIYKIDLNTRKITEKLSAPVIKEWPESNQFFISGGGKYIIVHNEMAALTGIYDSKTLKPLHKIPVTENIERIFVSENGENVYMCCPLNNSPQNIDCGYDFIKYKIPTGEQENKYVSGIILGADLKNQIFTTKDNGESHKCDFTMINGNTMTLTTIKANNPRQIIVPNNEGYYMGNNCRIFNFEKGEYLMLKPEYEMQLSTAVPNSNMFLISNASNEFYFVQLADKKLIAKSKIITKSSKNEVINFNDADAPKFNLQSVKEYRDELEKNKQKMIALEEAAKKAEELALIEREKEFGALCTNCKGKGYDEARECQARACDRGYVYGDKSETLYQNGAIVFKRTQSQVPCRLCKGRNIWICDVCKGTGGK